jgi:predicted phage terminase large subunit-like protein
MQLTPEQLREIGPEALQKIRAELARRSLKEFVHQAWKIVEPGTPLVWGWPMDAICEHLEAVSNGDIRRLLITVPPGTSKSRLTRVFYPCFQWVRDPHHRFISASYQLDLTVRDNLDARRIVSSEWYGQNFGINLAEDDGGKVGFSLNTLGSLKALTVGGKTTGFRGDTFLVDDPLNVQDGNSDLRRSEANEWFREAAQSRLNDVNKSSIIVIMQRIHQEDVAAVAMEMGYDHLNIPMRWEETQRKTTSIGWTDPRTEEGQLMWPERFPKWWVDQQEDAETGMGPYAFAAQMQQTPVPRKGGLIRVDSLKTVETLPQEPFLRVRAWDLAGTEGAGAYTVGVLMLYGQESRQYYIADVVRRQLGGGGVRELIMRTAEADGVATKIVLPQDPGAAGKTVVNELRAMLAGFNTRAEAQSGEKALRAAPFADQVEIGRISVLKTSWTKEYIEELRFFPRGRFKDQVDATASAFNELAPLTRKNNKTPHLRVVGEKSENVHKVA